MAIIEVKNLVKEYQLGQLTRLKDTLRNLMKRLQGKPPVKRKKFKALAGVNFTIEKGEVVGIIGTNGAGKSTLLKHLARITTPTSGSVKVDGSVAPLIEVGAGFVPDLTGRENIYLNCAIMGLSRKEIDEKIDEIIEFSELEEFIDTPVKRYSSGMAVRLGFSVATSIEADILIVDEVLAVGDLAFQRKCFDRMEDLIKRQGKTVLLVSHNIRQVQRLCSRVVHIEHGKIKCIGDPVEVCNQFYKQNNEKIKKHTADSIAKNNLLRASGEVELISFETFDKNKKAVDGIDSGDSLYVEVNLKINQRLDKPEFIVGIHTTDFIYLTACSTVVYKDRPDLEIGEHKVSCCFQKISLVSGVYCLWFGVVDKYRRTIFANENLKIFSVNNHELEIQLPDRRIFDVPISWGIDDKQFPLRHGAIEVTSG